jgi:HK97 family phage prohead protease
MELEEELIFPEGERKAIYNLLAFYYKKFDKEPPELRSVEDLDFENDDFPTKEEENYKDFSIEIKAEDVQEDGIFEGYASTFGGIPDSYGDIMAPGAFAETINHGGRNRNGIALLWYHNPREPVGVWLSIIEDSKGLKVRGQLDLEVQRGRELYSLLKKGAIKGMSIGWDFYRNRKREIRKDSYEIVEKGEYGARTRLLKQIELWEISLVTFAANKRAKVTKVKSITEASTERELEKVLREAGLSKSDSQYLVKLCRPSLRDSKDDGNRKDVNSQNNNNDNPTEIDIDPILKSLRNANLSLEISRRIYGS